MTDQDLMDSLKHEGAQWFSNEKLLQLEELFRRYKRCQASPSINPTTT